MSEEERLKERIYKVVPSCSLHMMELLSIMEIKITFFMHWYPKSMKN